MAHDQIFFKPPVVQIPRLAINYETKSQSDESVAARGGPRCA